MNLMRTFIVPIFAGSLIGNVSAGEESGRLLAVSNANEMSGYAGLGSPIPDDLKVSIQTQFRYSINKRGSDSTTLAGPKDDLTLGFTARRTKVGIEGKLTDSISARVKFGFGQSTGTPALENAVFKWKVSDTVVFGVGQFKPRLIREENISSTRQLATDRSSANETINQDYTQGVELAITEDDWRATVSFNEGIGVDNTFYTSAAEADYAVNARGELRFGGASWSQFKQFTSWRGADGGLMLGAAVSYQGMGNTNPSTVPQTEMAIFTADASLLGDGWNLFAAGTWRSVNTGAMTLTDGGFVLQGGVFVSGNDEFFARWDLVMPSDSNPTVIGVSGSKDFNTFTIGWNHYIIPDSHAAKFTLEVQHYADATTESIVAIRGNLLPDSTTDQFALTAQIQLLF